MPVQISAKFRTISPEMRSLLNGNYIRRGIQNGLGVIGRELVETAQIGMESSPKNYRTYYINGKRTMSASPGTYAADQTGWLRKSISFQQESFHGEFGAEATYAKYLQSNNAYKDNPWKKVAPRPFLSLSHRENSKDFERIMENELNRALPLRGQK